MLRFALKNLWVRRVKALLILLSIMISACAALLAYNVSSQISDGIITTAGYYDMIIGPAGSSTQLAMNTMFFTDSPLGTIPYSIVEELRRSGRVNDVIPFSMGDSYQGSRIVGTTAQFLEGKDLAEGAMFEDTYECVLGSAVAAKNNLQVGDQIVTSHGLAETGAEHAASPLIVTGILKETDTAYDNAVFTSCKTLWALHGDEEEEEDEEAHESHESHDHAEDGEICAVLVRTKSFNDYYALQSAYSGDSSLLVINPATVLREVLSNVDLSSRIVYLLCGVILIMNVFVIAMITILNMVDSRKEIALMRLIGIRMGRIARMYMIQNAVVGLLATLLSLVAAHALLGAMQAFVSSMGIVLNVWRVYPMEWILLLAVFVISVLPTLICIMVQARKDGLDR